MVLRYTCYVPMALQVEPKASRDLIEDRSRVLVGVYDDRNDCQFGVKLGF